LCTDKNAGETCKRREKARIVCEKIYGSVNTLRSTVNQIDRCLFKTVALNNYLFVLVLQAGICLFGFQGAEFVVDGDSGKQSSMGTQT